MAAKPAPPADVEPPATTAAAERPMPTNVIAAIARVMEEVGGIEKLTQAQRQARGMSGGQQGITYAYRGVDQIAAAAQPLFGRYGAVIVPTILDRDQSVVEVGGKPWVDLTLTVRWDIYGPGGAADMISSVTHGEARDNSDKATNKAMTGAFKNLLLRILCIGDPQDDTDGHTYERDAAGDQRDEPVEERPDPALVSATFERIKALAADDGQKVRLDKLRRFAAARQLGLSEVKLATSVSYLDAIIALLDEPERDDEESPAGAAPAGESPANAPQTATAGRARKEKAPDPAPDPETAVVEALTDAFPGSTLEEGEPGDR